MFPLSIKGSAEAGDSHWTCSSSSQCATVAPKEFTPRISRHSMKFYELSAILTDMGKAGTSVTFGCEDDRIVWTRRV